MKTCVEDTQGYDICMVVSSCSGLLGIEVVQHDFGLKNSTLMGITPKQNVYTRL